MTIAEQIKDRISMPDVLERYGFSLHRSKRIPCPFHNGKDRNLSYNQKVYHCFVCGAGGDVIRFVMDYFQIGYVAAINRINADFCLGLTSRRPTIRDRQKAAEANRIRQEVAAEAEMKRVVWIKVAGVRARADRDGETEFVDELDQWLDEHEWWVTK